MSDKLPPHIMKLLVAWARERHIPKPTTPEGMRALSAQFFADLQVRAAQQTQYVLKQFGEDPAIIRASDPAVHLNRTRGNMLDIADAEDETDHDDFAEIARGRQAAMDEAGGDDLAANVLYRDHVEARRNAEAPIHSEAPLSHVKTLFGATIGVQPGSLTTLMGPFVQVVSWPGDDNECRAVSIDVAPMPAQVDGKGNLRVPGSAVARPVALVEWGTSQGLYHALVDLGSGMHLTIACSSVNVSIALDAGSTAAMEVYGSMSFGASAHPTPATRTSYIDGITSGNGPVVTFRPPFATTIIAVDRSDFTAAMTLTYKDLGGNTIGQRIFAASTTVDAPLFLPNDCVEVDVSTGSAGAINARLVYGLTL